MDREEALKLLRGGPEGVKEWNRRRADREDIPSLRDATLVDVKLVDANLSRANLSAAKLYREDLTSANLSSTDVSGTVLRWANFFKASLNCASLYYTDLSSANLQSVDFGGAVLKANSLSGTKFSNAFLNSTKLADLDLSKAIGLDHVKFKGPCSIGVDTLVKSKGEIPESFHRGRGFEPWQIVAAKCYDPNLRSDSPLPLR